MKLIQLRYLVGVAENDLNITQAARVLHAAQPGAHLTQRQVQASENAASQEEVDREFAGVKIPFLR